MQPVCEWRNDKTLDTSEVLIHVLKVDVSDGNHALVLVLLVVEPRLLQPLEVCRRLYSLCFLPFTTTKQTNELETAKKAS